MIDAVSLWYADYIELPRDSLFDIIMAANYLDIKPLLDLACCRVACMMKGRCTTEVRQMFDIVNDFTPEEEEKIIAENKWAEETF